MAVVCRIGKVVTAIRRDSSANATTHTEHCDIGIFGTIPCRDLLRAFAVSAAIFSGGAGVWAQDATELAAEPLLRIETGKHSALIHRLDADSVGSFAVSASDDKTVRVWALSDGRPINVLRLPIGQGDFGKAFAVAISPDGRTVAAGGYAGPAGRNNIFLFDRASGELKQRLSDLPDVIGHLGYSPDCRRLAASLKGANGIRVFDVSKAYEVLPGDTQYGDTSYWAAFDPSGKLVTTSWDGFVRLYAADHYDSPIARFKTSGQGFPYSAAFSPDGTRIALGYRDTKEVLVLSGADLKELFKPSTIGIPDIGLLAVGWSDDGRFLFAGGFWQMRNMGQVRRWKDGGRGAFVDIPAGANTIQQILGLKEGRLLVASTKSLRVIQEDGRPVWIQGLGDLDLGSLRNPLRISEMAGWFRLIRGSPFTLIGSLSPAES
jgi:WD40 repeat protein